MILARSLPACDPPHAVNVTGHEMSAQPPVRLQWPLQIHQRANAGKLQVCALPRFLEEIELNQFSFPARTRLHRRETTAIDRQAISHLQSPPARLHADG